MQQPFFHVPAWSVNCPLPTVQLKSPVIIAQKAESPGYVCVCVCVFVCACQWRSVDKLKPKPPWNDLFEHAHANSSMPCACGTEDYGCKGLLWYSLLIVSIFFSIPLPRSCLLPSSKQCNWQSAISQSRGTFSKAQQTILMCRACACAHVRVVHVPFARLCMCLYVCDPYINTFPGTSACQRLADTPPTSCGGQTNWGSRRAGKACM